jgi:hypothetical protein
VEGYKHEPRQGSRPGRSLRGSASLQDRLNTLFTPAGWTRKYTIHASANFERSKDQKIVAKVLVTCELTIFGLGSHSATGEDWADNHPAVTSAEGQAFKRASSCFGRGRYLYYFDGVWVDLDERKQPRSVPQLPGWATPAGWLQGLRPHGSGKSNGGTNGAKASDSCLEQSSLAAEIESMAELLGRGLYRGLLRDLGRVWSPKEIQDLSLQQRVLEHMQSGERGVKRLEAALDKLGPEALIPVLKTHGLASIERVGNLETLKTNRGRTGTHRRNQLLTVCHFAPTISSAPPTSEPFAPSLSVLQSWLNQWKRRTSDENSCDHASPFVCRTQTVTYRARFWRRSTDRLSTSLSVTCVEIGEISAKKARPTTN